MADVTKEAFQAEVLESSVPVLVDFYAPWCGPCRAMNPLLKEMEAAADGKYKIVKVNCDEQRDLAATYNISGLPTFVVFSGGKVTNTLVGSQPKQRLLEALA